MRGKGEMDSLEGTRDGQHRSTGGSSKGDATREILTRRGDLGLRETYDISFRMVQT